MDKISGKKRAKISVMDAENFIGDLVEQLDISAVDNTLCYLNHSAVIDYYLETNDLVKQLCILIEEAFNCDCVNIGFEKFDLEFSNGELFELSVKKKLGASNFA